MQTPGTTRSPGPRQVRDGGHHPQIDVASIEECRADRRRVEAQRQRVAVLVEPVDERTDVQIIDGAKADGRHHDEDLVASIPGRGRGAGRANLALDLFLWRAAQADRRIGHRRDAVDVVCAIRDRHLRQLRAVQRPVHLDCGNGAAHQPRRGHCAHVVVPGGRRVGRIQTRERRERAEGAGFGLDDRRALNQIEPRSHGGPIDRRPPHVQAAMADRANDFDRILGVAKSIQRRFGNRLEAGFAERLRCFRKRQMVVTRQRQQVRERKRGQRQFPGERPRLADYARRPRRTTRADPAARISPASLVSCWANEAFTTSTRP